MYACYLLSKVILLLYYYIINFFITLKSNFITMTPKQCKMARAGLGWTVSQLAEKTSGRPATVSNFERGGVSKSSTVIAIENAFISTGRVTFTGKDCVCVTDPESIKKPDHLTE